jgi:hypothetical protein
LFVMPGLTGASSNHGRLSVYWVAKPGDDSVAESKRRARARHFLKPPNLGARAERDALHPGG